MAKLKDITHWLNNYLKNDEVQDNCWNGLQIEGNSEVKKIALAVDAGLDIFNEAKKLNAEFLIVHHGHFWKGADPTITDWRKERLAPLFDNNISLYASHLPLDRHPEIGHNAQIIKFLGAEIHGEFYQHHGANIGYTGIFKEPTSREDLIKKINKVLHTNATTLSFGSDTISSVAVCSGHGGYGAFFEALDRKVDLYISGDAVEIYQTAKDAHMNVIFAGHYASETLGLKALANKLEDEKQIETVFIDQPTGL